MRKGKADRQTEQRTMLSEYGKKKLLTYADSFAQLARSFEDEFKWEQSEDREGYLYTRRLWENRRILSDNLNEMANIMRGVAEETFRYQPLADKKYKQVVTAMRLEKIYIQDICYIEAEDGRTSLGMCMRTDKKGGYSAEDVGSMLSILFDMPLTPSVSSPYFLDGEFRNYTFVEEAKFVVLTGVAKAVKETETISGDNYSLFESEKGKLTILISDGMGSGEKACADSDAVLDLMEKLLEAGYNSETAIQMVNSTLAIKSDEQNMSTLDICELDLYNGICEFRKVGAACSFIKRMNLVEQISGRNLPLGIFQKIDTEVVRRRLMDGDILILLSDGVLDGLEQSGCEDAMCEIISRLNTDSPKEIAETLLQYVLHQSKGHIRDDMTIIVAGVWEKT